MGRYKCAFIASFLSVGLSPAAFAANYQTEGTIDPLVPASENVPAQNLSSFQININPTPGLSANPAALAAFQRAANQWAAYLADPVSINIDADLAPLGAGIIGSTNSVFLQGSTSLIRNQMVTDASDEASNAIVGSLPTSPSFSIPSGTSLSGSMMGTKANLKALGFANLDAGFGATDATITFSSNFSFDYDRSNGITPGTMDFETVAAHEIGHALGFVSIVDSVNAGTTNISPTPLDLFRFSAGVNPATVAEFSTAVRELIPGQAAIFDDLSNEYSMSTGTASSFPGTDGNQASHWKANELTGQLIGILDPTLGYGEVVNISSADLRALDIIGYEVIPEPTTLGLAAISSVLLLHRKRAKRVA